MSYKPNIKGINAVRGIFGDDIVRSAVIYDGEDELDADVNGVYNIRRFPELLRRG